MSESATTAADAPRPDRSRATRTLGVTGLNHALHDGYTDLIYVLLPIWQAEFALSYGLLALLRGLYSAAMAGLQIPVSRFAARIDGKFILMAGTLVAALGYVLAGLSGGVIGLALALALSGAGSSTQHPIASAAVSRAYGKAARGPLGIYNFSGDLGKAAIPAATSVLLVIMTWRHTLLVMALVGLFVAACIALAMPRVGKGADLDELDGGVRVVAPVPRMVAVGLRQEPLRVVVTDGADGHPGIPGELADGQHGSIMGAHPILPR